MSTTDFSRNYLPPGVYIEENTSLVVASTGVPPTRVALVGPGRGYQIAVEQIPLGPTAIRLSRQGIDLASISVVAASTRVEVPATDYQATKVDQNENVEQDYYVTIAETSENDLADGSMVFVTYNYQPVDYFDPKLVRSYEDVKDLYGEPLNLAPVGENETYEYVLSPLALAAKIALENGATELVLCAAALPSAAATTDAAKSAERRTALAAAYEKVATLPEVNIVVGLPTGVIAADAGGAALDLANHVTNATNDGFARFGVIGFDVSVSTAPDALLATAGVKNKRLMLAYTGPGGLLMYSGGANATFAASHAYLAAAYAGRMAALPVQRSLTKQVISSFSGLGGTPLSNALKNQYAQAGVAVAEVDRLNRLVVRHGVTTDPSNVNTREAAVVRARDTLVSLVSNGFAESDLVGQPIDDEVLFVVKSTMQGFLETAVDVEMIVNYSGLAVRQRSTEPSVVEVKFAYKPAYPLNYIAVSFSIDMATAAVADLAEVA